MTPFAFYGTLMDDGTREMRQFGVYAGPCVIRGDLYDTGAFPALVAGEGSVRGQLWAPYYPDQGAELIDRIEGFDPMGEPSSNLYTRRLATLVEPEGMWAWVYAWNRPMAGLAPIPDGDWRAWKRKGSTAGGDYPFAWAD